SARRPQAAARRDRATAGRPRRQRPGTPAARLLQGGREQGLVAHRTDPPRTGPEYSRDGRHQAKNVPRPTPGCPRLSGLIPCAARTGVRRPSPIRRRPGPEHVRRGVLFFGFSGRDPLEARLVGLRFFPGLTPEEAGNLKIPRPPPTGPGSTPPGTANPSED